MFAEVAVPGMCLGERSHPIRFCRRSVRIWRKHGETQRLPVACGMNRRWLDHTGLPAKRALDSGRQVAIHPDDLSALWAWWAARESAPMWPLNTLEQGSRRIRVNACCPGPIAGRMTFRLADAVSAGTGQVFCREGAEDVATAP